MKILNCLLTFITFGHVFIARQVLGDGPLDDSGTDFSEQVFLRPGNVRTLSTFGTATEDRDAIQKLTLGLHQVLELRVDGTVNSGDYTIEVCDFNVELPGDVQYAGEVKPSEIVVVTDSFNISAEYLAAGVPQTGQYPVRISTTPDPATQGSKVYVLEMSKCNFGGFSECTLLLPLGTNYEGDSVKDGTGKVWGCSWRSTRRLGLSATSNDAKSALEDLLGAGLVRSVTKTSNYAGVGSFKFEIVFEPGVVDLYARIDDFALRGSGMYRTTSELAKGYPTNSAFNLAAQGWGGYFRVAMQTNPNIFTDPIAPATSGPDFVTILRRLPDVDGAVTASKASNGMSWSITFPSKGFVPLVISNVTQLEPYGASLTSSHTVEGQARIGGEFQLEVDWSGNGTDLRTAMVNHAASSSNLEARLLSLGFQDISVSVSGPTTYNGYTWAVTFFGDCPSRGLHEGLVTTERCSAWQLAEGQESELTGNDVTLSISSPLTVPLDASDFGLFEDSLVGPLQWQVTESTPNTLPSPVVDDVSRFSTFFTFPQTAVGRYRVALTDQGTGQVVASASMYADSRPPRASAGLDKVVAFPVSFTTLYGSDSTAFYSTTIISYRWTRVSAPPGASATAGQLVEPTRADVVVSNLNTPGDFVYELRVTDSLGIESTDRVKVSVLFAPTVGSIPDQSAIPGTNLTMACLATGSSPLAIRWFQNGVPLDGATKPQLYLTRITEADQGNYSCTVTNTVASVSSNVAFLSVLDPPSFTTPLLSVRAFPTTDVALECQVQGTSPISYHWERSTNYTNLVWNGPEYSSTSGALPAPIAGAASWEQVGSGDWSDVTPDSSAQRTLNLFSVAESDEGLYRCVASNIVATFISPAVAILVEDAPSHVRVTVLPEEAGTTGIYPGEDQGFELTCETSNSTSVESYKWFNSRSESTVIGVDKVLAITNITFATHGGEYWCSAINTAGETTATPMYINIFAPPVVIQHPVGGRRDPGQNFTFEVEVIGLEPIYYSWQHNGEYLPQNVLYGPQLVLEDLTTQDAGEYRVVLFNDLGTGVTSNSATLVVTIIPSFVTHPQDTPDIDPGQPTSLSCTANGTLPITFRWVYRKDPSEAYYPVVGANEARGEDWTRLEFLSVSPDSEADYACEATNSAGTTRSNPGFLSVSDAPSIIDGPNDTFVDPGDTAVLVVIVEGATPLMYQWRKNGVNILGENSNTLTLTNVQLADEATYDCRITNRLKPSGVLSRGAVLRIARPPSIVAHPTNATGNPGSDLAIAATFSGAPLTTVEWLFRETLEDVAVVVETSNGLVEVETVSLRFANVTELSDGFYTLRVTNRLGSVTSEWGYLRVHDPPSIAAGLVSVTVDPGDSVTMECNAAADPPVSNFVWSFRRSQGSGLVVVQSSTASTLSLSAAAQEDEGVYLCYAENIAGSVRKELYELVVRDPPSVIRLLPDTSDSPDGVLRVDRGQAVTLSVVAEGLEPISFEWFLDGASVSSLSPANVQLAIASADDVHEGRYTVRAVNPLGSDESATWIDFELNVPAEVVRLDIDPATGRVEPLRPVSVDCESAGSPPFQFEWTIGSVQVNSNTFPTVSLLQSSPNITTLFIPEATDATEGLIECHVRNSANPVGSSRTVLLEALNRVVLDSASPLDTRTVPGTDATLECIVFEGSDPFQVTWYRGDALNRESLVPDSTNNITVGKFLGAAEDLFNGTSVVLTITNPQEIDEQVYSCEVCNELGCEVSRDAQFTVHNKPVITSQYPSADSPVAAVNPHTSLEVEVVAVGMEPLNFLWEVTRLGEILPEVVVADGTDVFFSPAECTSSGVPCKLVFSSIRSLHAGNYTCTVSNALGTTQSVPVLVSVNEPPALQSSAYWPPALKTACPGDHFIHALDIAGTRPMTIDWYFSTLHSTPSTLFGLTDPFLRTSMDRLSIASPSFLNEGFYGFIATNVAGTYTSTVSQLRVNEGPQAAADAAGESPHHAVTLPKSTTALFGQSSSDEFSTIVQYNWTVQHAPVDPKTGQNQTVHISDAGSANTQVSGLHTPGEYTFELKVVNEMGCTDTDQVRVRVNQPPVIVVRDVTIAIPTQDAVLDASSSYDPDPDDTVTSFRWILSKVNGEPLQVGHGSGITMSAPTQAITRIMDFDVGTYEFELAIRDTFGAVSLKRVLFTVFQIAVVSPGVDHNSTFSIGTCQSHAIQWTIQGGLNGDTNTEIWLVEDNPLTESPWRHQIASGKLVDFELFSGSAFYTYDWIPDFTVPVLHDTITRVEIVLPISQVSSVQDQVVRASSGIVSLAYPYQYKVSKWSDCQTGAPCQMGTQSRDVICVESQTCSANALPDQNSIVQVETSLCERYSAKPVSVRACFSAPAGAGVCDGSEYRWAVGDWDDSDCHPNTPCHGTSTRDVSCVFASTNAVASSPLLCAQEQKPAVSRSCASAQQNQCPAYTSGPDRRISPSRNAVNFPSCSVPDTSLETANLGQIGRLCFGAHGLPVYADPPPPPCTAAAAVFVPQSPSSCSNRYWRVSGWACLNDSGTATRTIACVSASNTLDILPNDSCTGLQRPITELEGACSSGSGSGPSDGHNFMWMASTSWTNCDPMTCTQKRDVSCMNTKTGTIAASAASCSGHYVPVNSRSCPDRSNCNSLALREGSCASGELRCIKGRCDWATGECDCDGGWSGESCDTMDECFQQGGFTDLTGTCCLGRLDASGLCCPSGVTDREGACCSNGNLDPCGVCGGSGRMLDIFGRCCSTELDYSGKCCEAGFVDRCGVCGGSGLSCFVQVDTTMLPPTEISSQSSFMASKEGIALVFTWLRAHVEASLELSVRQVEVFSASLVQDDQQRIRRLANYRKPWHVSVGVLPSSTASLQELHALGSNSNFTQFPVFLEPRGLCGNGVCEAKERCLFQQGSGCCPVDCPVSLQPSPCPQSNGLVCGARGQCLWGASLCVCNVGYMGDACERCAPGYKPHVSSLGGSHCVPQLPSVAALTATAPPTTAPSAGNNTIIVEYRDNLLPAPLVVFVLLFLLLLAVLWYRERRVRQEKLRGTWVHHDDSLDPVAPPATPDEARKALISGWLWKRSRMNLDGHHVWHQWYMALTRPADPTAKVSHSIEYFDSEEAFHAVVAQPDEASLERKKQEEFPDGRDSNDVDREHGFISMDGLVKVEEYPPNDRGLFPIALVFPGTDGKSGSRDVSDVEVYWGNDDLEQGQSGSYRIKLLTESRQKQEEWLRRLSRIALDPIVPLKEPTVERQEGSSQTSSKRSREVRRQGAKEGTSLSGTSQSIDSSMSPFGSISDESGSITTVAAFENYSDAFSTSKQSNVPEGAFVGSLSGNLGERVVYFGHVHVKLVGETENSQEKRWKRLTAVLLYDRDELMFFYHSRIGKDSETISCWDIKRSIHLRDLQLIKDLGVEGNKRMKSCFEIEYHTVSRGLESLYVMAPKRDVCTRWVQCLADQLEHKLGRDIVARANQGEAAPNAEVEVPPRDLAVLGELRSNQRRRSSLSSRRGSRQEPSVNTPAVPVTSTISSTRTTHPYHPPKLRLNARRSSNANGGESQSVYQDFQRALSGLEENQNDQQRPRSDLKSGVHSPLSDHTNARML